MSFKLPTKLVNKSLDIIVVGAGGTGSAVITELFQMSYLLDSLSNGEVKLNVTVYDDDVVSFANVGRQSFWACDVNLNKAKVLVSRFNAYGNVNWQAKETRFEPDMLTQKTDIIITCSDSAKFRGELGKKHKDSLASWLWLDLGNAENDGQVILGQLGQNDKSLLNVYDYYPDLINAEDKEEDSCSHEIALAKQGYGINKSVALAGTTMLWQLIRHGEIHHQGSFIDLKLGETKSIAC